MTIDRIIPNGHYRQPALPAAAADVIPGEPLLLSRRDAAKFLAIGERTLWQLTADGEIPSMKIRKLVRYDVRDLIAYVDRHKRHGQASGPA